MLNKALALLARLTIGKKLLALAASLNAKLSGHRTEIILGLEALLYALKKLGLIPAGAEQAATVLATALLGALPVTLAEKVKRAQELTDKAVPDQPAQ